MTIMKFSKRPQKLGRDYEAKVAKDYGGKRQEMSGAHWASKSDIKTDSFLIEVKFTVNDAYVLHYEDLNNCFNHAYKINKIPLFQIGFYGGQEFVIMEQDTFDLEGEMKDIYIKPGARTKSLNKYDLLEKPEIKTMIYNKLRLYLLPKKLFKELLDNEQDKPDKAN